MSDDADPAATHRVEAGDGPALAGPSLLVLSAGGLSLHPLPEAGRITIGRADDAGVRLADPSISRSHALLELGPKSIVVSDLGSANGVTVRGARLEQGARATVAPGEPIGLGTVTVVVQGGPAPRGRGWVASPEGTSVYVADSKTARSLTPVVAVEPSMCEALSLAERIAPSPITVLLLGETGVGKELVATRVHEASGRSGPLAPLNCAAISASLLESELFGHERGAFTGAHAMKPGLLEAAARGTVFLDEVGELPLELQAKLLRALEQREVMRVGGRAPVPIDVRFVAATNRDLVGDTERGAFRADLYYRLNGITIEVPPLRERPLDLVPLVERFLAPSGSSISDDALDALRAHRFPGNVRELRHALERAVVLAGAGNGIEREHLPKEIAASAGGASRRPAGPASSDRPPADERERILWALDRCAFNQTRAAELLGISRRTLVTRIKEHRIPRPRKGYADE